MYNIVNEQYGVYITMIIIEEKEVREKLKPEKAVELMREAFLGLENGLFLQPLRTVNIFPGNNAFGFMPAHLGDAGFGAKIITAYPSNIGTEYPSHMGYVMYFENEHGSPVGMADCSSITEIRTGAVSAVATDLLSRKDSHILSLIGAGAQARSHARAIVTVRDINEINVFDIRKEASVRFAKEMNEELGVKINIHDDYRSCVKNADIICTLTPSKDAYLDLEDVREGVHINAVGTFTPVTREITGNLVKASRFYADEISAMKKESGEYLIPLSEGLITEEHILGSIGSLLAGKSTGRVSDKDITVFDALGLAVEDVICARYLIMGK